MAAQKQFGTLLLLVSLAMAQDMTSGTAAVKSVQVVRAGNDVRVEVTLSAPVKASVITAKDPDRLVLDLPNTLPGAEQQHIAVNHSGVRAVRVGLNRANPPVTRVVVDLDQAQPYALQSDGNRISLTVSPAVSSRTSPRRGAPTAGASGGLIGIFRRRQSTPPPVASADSTPVPPPPPSGPSIAFPAGQSTDNEASTTASTSSQPTAAHPNRASLEEGTVFPSLGAPGTGNVPAASGPTPGTFGSTSGGSSSGTIASAQPNRTAAQSGTTFSGNVSMASTPSPITVAPVPHVTAETASANSTPAPVAAPESTSKQPVAQSSSISVAVAPPIAPPPPAALKAPAEQSQPSPTLSPTPAGAVTPTVAQNSDTNASPAPANSSAAADTSADANLPVLALRALDPNLRTVFKVKYVAEGVAYLDGGRSSGLTEGMKLEIKDSDLPVQQGVTVDPTDPRVVAELEVSAVADTSAVTDIRLPKRQVKPGDLAYLSDGDAQVLVQQRALSTTRKYPAVITFTEGDPLEEEARAEVPRPPLPSVNRARGRIGFDYLGTMSHGSSATTSSDLGLVLRADITRINGTYWNLSGYWRGRLDSRSSTGPQTLQDLINRTYHLSMIYDNPNSPWVAGFGRLYLPWASSLDTIDGGYFGRRVAEGTTAGIFAGSTPDPTSWDFNVDRRIGGAFINFEGGSFDAFRYTSTSGLGVSTLKWQIDRPFVFFENGFFYKRYLSIYHSLQADSPRANPAVPAPGPGLSRSFLTVRIQPHPRVELDFNHNYFRDIPTFDPQLIGTGLLDKYLFQGFSVGARVEVAKQIWVYTDLGRSNRTGDAKNSLNQMYGVTFGNLPWLGLRADAHYSRFNSSFGDGSYRAFSLSRTFSDSLRLEVLAGDQSFSSPLSSVNRSRFINSNLDFSIGMHYFMQGGFTVNRGEFSYDQWMFTLGYRFDSKSKHQ
jgi:hypothetical protein